MMAAPILYYSSISPPARFALWTAKYLKISVGIKKVDLFAGEQYAEDYVKINPKRTVPTLVRGNLKICDSHAIATYLCDEFRKNHTIYPVESGKRALIDQMLHFNNGILFPLDSLVMSTHFAKGRQTAEELKPHEQSLSKHLNVLEHYLKEEPWLAGKEMTIADLCCISTLETLNLLLPISKENRLINEWRTRCRNISYYDEINKMGLSDLKNKLKQY